MTTETKTCQNCKEEFVIEPDDAAFYEKMKVPGPTFCPRCRLVRRFSFRNERYLYKRTCAFCNKDIISIFSPDKPFKAYCQDEWWSDKWDAAEYGRDYDFSRPFFEQMRELMLDVPWVTLTNTYSTMVNSDYCNMSSHSKNCYLTSHADHNEDCMYGSGVKFSKDCVDVTMVQASEQVYDSLNIMKGSRNLYSIDCENSHNVYFSKNLVGCNDCFGCVNLRHKSYHIFNEPYSKEEYEQKLKEFSIGSYKSVQELKVKAHEFWKQFPSRFYHGSHNQNVSGDYIYNSKNVLYSYEMMEAEDCKYCQNLSTKPSKDCMDFTEWGDRASLIYDTVIAGMGISNIKFSWSAYTNSHDVEYSMWVSDCQYLFGCVGLRHKKYSILNKEYSKESFEKLRTKIIQHMKDMPYTDAKGRVYPYGEFFPSELSPFAYNETAQEFFPLPKDQAISQGFVWREDDKKQYQQSEYKVPDHISEVKDDIVQQVLACGACEKNYRIISPELAFYRAMEIPAPQTCPDCRHFARIVFRSPMTSSLRNCSKCGKELQTNITPKISPLLYCEACYLAEVV